LDRKTSVKKIFIDGIDDFFIRQIYKHPEIDYYFKRELYKIKLSQLKKIEWQLRYTYELTRTPGTKNKRKLWFSYWNIPIGIAYKSKFNNILPLPLTVAKPIKLPIIKKKEYQVSFVGHINNHERAYYVALLKTYLNKNGAKSFLSSKIVNKVKYIDIIRKSKAGLATRGTGYDTWRYWEVPCYGAALLSQKTPILIPNNFIDNESALFFKNFDELKYKLQKYVIKSNEWEEIAKNGQRQFFKYHTPKNRVEYILDNIKE